MSKYEVSMSNYYAKSKDYKDKYQSVVDSVQSNFIDKVTQNISELDSQDQTTLEGKSSYTSTVSSLSSANDTTLPELDKMSSESDSNPMNPIPSTDKQYAQKFGEFSSGQRTEDIKTQVEEINLDIEFRRQVDYWLAHMPKDVTPELIKTIQSLLKQDPRAAFKALYESEDFWTKVMTRPELQDDYLRFLQKLEDFPGYIKYAKEFIYNNEKVWDILQASDKLQDILFAYVGFAQGVQNLPAKIAEKLYNHPTFFDKLAKAPEWIQNRIINAMAMAEDGSFWAKMIGDGSKIGGFFNKITATLQTVKSGKFFQAVSKLIKSPLAQKLIKNPVMQKLMGPWGGLIINAGFEAFANYNDPTSREYKSVGKSIIGGGIDAVKNASYLDGALIGAQLGMGAGFPGMVAGALAGAAIVGVKNVIGVVFPDWDKNLKDGIYNVYDSVANSSIGKGITNSVNKVKETVGNTINQAGKHVSNFFKEAAQSFLPKPSGATFGWFR